MVNRTTSGIIATSFLSLSRVLSPAGAYYLFAGVAAGAYLFIRQRVPETKGRSLEDIERQMTEMNLPTTTLLTTGVALTASRSL